MTRSTDTTTPGRARPLGPARIVALVLVGLAVLGLAYLRFGPDDHAVSVPKGAHAGDLILKRSTYGTEKGNYVADVGTLVVPENRADPKSRLIALPVTRIRARSEHPASRSSGSRAGPGSATCTSRRRAASPTTATSSSSATGASTARSGSTVPRSSRRSSTRPTCSAESALPPGPMRSAPAPTGSRTTASTSPATRFRSGSTTSRPHARRSATAASTSSARAPARARR